MTLIFPYSAVKPWGWLKPSELKWQLRPSVKSKHLKLLRTYSAPLAVFHIWNEVVLTAKRTANSFFPSCQSSSKCKLTKLTSVSTTHSFSGILIRGLVLVGTASSGRNSTIQCLCTWLRASLPCQFWVLYRTPSTVLPIFSWWYRFILRQYH